MMHGDSTCKTSMKSSRPIIRQEDCFLVGSSFVTWIFRRDEDVEHVA